jgi:hypothetical protein
MKKIIIYSSFCLFYLFSFELSAKTISLKDGLKFKLKEIKGWTILKDKFKSPLIILGPKEFKRRPVINIFPIKGIDTFKFNSLKLNESQKNYQDIKSKWIKDKGGRVDSFINYEKLKWKNHSKINTIGVVYNLYGEVFVEKSHYFICNKKPVHIKTLISDISEKELKNLKNILENIYCY